MNDHSEYEKKLQCKFCATHNSGTLRGAITRVPDMGSLRTKTFVDKIRPRIYIWNLSSIDTTNCSNFSRTENPLILADCHRAISKPLSLLAQMPQSNASRLRERFLRESQQQASSRISALECFFFYLFFSFCFIFSCFLMNWRHFSIFVLFYMTTVTKETLPNAPPRRGCNPPL